MISSEKRDRCIIKMEQVGQKFQGKVPVRHAVQRVVHGLFEAQQLGGAEPVHGVGGGRQGAGAQGALIHPLHAVLQASDVPAEHIGVGHHRVGEGDGLGPLQVGIAGHDGVQVGLGLADQGLFQVHQHGDDVGNLLFYIKTEVHGDLIVPAAGGVQTLAGGADALGQQDLHVHVDVLTVLGELHFPGLDLFQKNFQGGNDLVRLFLGDDALFPQHGGVGDGTGDVLAVEPSVEGDGGVEVVYLVIGFLLKPSCPKFHSRWHPFQETAVSRDEKSSPCPAQINSSNLS